MSQGWAGAGYGIVAVPRIGQEVLIAFLGGDPEEPIVVGCIANAHNPLPYSLPENETKTVWRSRTTPGSGGYNEISFEDRKGDERIYERAEKDKESLIRNDERMHVGRNRAKVVKEDEESAILGDRRELIGGDDHRTVRGEQCEHVVGTRSLSIDGDLHIRVGGRILIEAGGEIHFTSETKIVRDAPDLTDNADGGFVHVTGGGVDMDGPAVRIQAGGAPASGADSDPEMPELPAMALGFLGTPLARQGRPVPMFPFGLPGIAGNPTVIPEREIICRAICGCNTAHNGTQRVRQWCVSKALWMYDKGLSNQSTIKAEVPYDMSKKPPAPIMSRNDPTRPKRGRPEGSRIPDVVVVKDGTKPPTQDNIKKVYEIKFPGDREMSWETKQAYQKISGAVRVDVLRPSNCGCDTMELDPLPQPISAAEAAATVLLLLLAVALLVDGVPGDEVLAPELVRRLLVRLAPLLLKLQPVTPPFMQPSP